MKIQSVIKFLPAVTLLASIAYSTLVFAHVMQFQILGSSATEVDIYQVNCYSQSTAYLDLSLRDNRAGASSITAVVLKGNAAISYTDSVGGNQLPQEFTPGASQLAQAAGIYTVLVSNSHAQKEFYDISFHC